VASVDSAQTGVASAGRARIGARTLRNDRWWRQQVVTVSALTAFIAYATYAAFANGNYYSEPYISPFYSPCLATSCTKQGAPSFGVFGSWWVISPAIIILLFPLGFRITCYYYRKAYYRGFWASPPACAVAEPHGKYSGETRFPLVVQNVHRWFFYIGVLFNLILTYDAVLAFRNHSGQWGHMGFGTIMLIVNALLLWLYTLGCHSCRHAVGGRINNFSKHPVRYKAWTWVSKLNGVHMQMAWASLLFVAFTDLYVRLLAAGVFSDPRFF
jgi:hypothetical protein